MPNVNDKIRADAQTIKSLTNLAKEFVVELNGDQEQLQVEEVVLSDDQQKWFITVSYLQVLNSPNELQRALRLLSRRVYKRVTIDSKTFRVLGMQNWSYVPQ